MSNIHIKGCVMGAIGDHSIGNVTFPAAGTITAPDTVYRREERKDRLVPEFSTEAKWLGDKLELHINGDFREVIRMVINGTKIERRSAPGSYPGAPDRVGWVEKHFLSVAADPHYSGTSH